ncbi:MAG: hypothetical protein Q4F34_07695, partial [Prevotellaceae bacterium]|nr:hypothetical protein [Prevotellaceae bacterium]
MAIFLDNETMYQRAIRKLKSMPHLEGDLPYPKGPKTPKDGGSLASNGNYYEYSNISTGSTVDTGYDDEIQYYFYENGQCQEQFRDQGHVIAGIMNMAVIMRTAWNQGEDLFNLDFGIGTENRMLKGLEYASRYNMSYLNKQEGYKYWSKDDKQAEVFEPTPVEDAGYNTVTDPEKFIKRLVRCARWKGVRSSADGRGAYLGEGMNDIYQMFKVQLGVPEDEMLWTTRMRQVNYELNDGHEKPYSSGHHYENLGWGDLTGERTPWMAGDGGKWVDGKFVLGLPTLPGTILASDYDNYVGMAMAGQKDGANGHTYYNDGTKSWKNYTVIMPTGGSYNISINVKSSKGGAKVTASTDDNNSTTSATIAATDGYEKVSLGLLAITSGAKVIRITVEGDIDDVDIQSFTVEKTKFRVLTMKVDKDYKYSTFVAPFDVKIPTGVTAYKVNCDGNKLILIKEAGESETLKADHPVVLYSEAGISKSFSGTGSVSDDDVTYGNLVGKYVKETGITDAQKYILFADASNPVGFYKTNDSSVDAYHAYLLLPETTAKDYFSFEEPSGIDEIKNAQSTMDDGQFNLQGIRVNNSYKGIIIKNGKKYISNQ